MTEIIDDYRPREIRDYVERKEREKSMRDKVVDDIAWSRRCIWTHKMLMQTNPNRSAEQLAEFAEEDRYHEKEIKSLTAVLQSMDTPHTNFRGRPSRAAPARQCE
jgi:hypothetical protein